MNNLLLFQIVLSSLWGCERDGLKNKSMRHLLYLAVFTLFIFVLSINVHAEYVPGELLVKYRNTVALSRVSMLHQNIAAVKKGEFKRINVHHIKLPDNMSVEDAIAYYSQDPDIEYAEPNYIVHATATPNDTFFSELWGLHNTGATVNLVSGTADADIDAPEAWDTVTGSSTVVIAVVDSGVAYNHPDLSANIWTNSGETGCSDGDDDDGNGYDDDCRGWDFVDGDNDPMDYNSHGTHVAGTIAAAGNSGSGITGVMWQAKIMPLRFLGADGSGLTTDAVQAILYANANGAHIINNSWGGSGFSMTLKAAIDASSALVVCAAGNGGLDGIGDDNDITPFYPAGYTSDNVISVAATDQNDLITSFSNFGAVSVDLTAPGKNVYSTVPARELDDNFDDGDISDWTTGGTLNTWAASNEFSYSGVYSLADSHNADYSNNTDSWARSPAINLSGKDGCMFTYRIKRELLSGDALHVEASTDGTSWVILNSYGSTASNDFLKLIEDLTAYDGNATVYVRFRLETNAASVDEGVYIDDAEIICTTTSYSGTEYEYFQGSSMATPHVSGVAGLIKANTSSLTSLQIKSAILGGVDTSASAPLSALVGKVATNGRLNAQGAIQSPLPSVSSSSGGGGGGGCFIQSASR